jgi:hypothetical protein
MEFANVYAVSELVK